MSYILQKLNFDIRGNLNPNDIIEVDFGTFKSTFIESYEEDSTRLRIFENYLNYLSEIQKMANERFYQWIDGSFVSTKFSPRDIDLVTVINLKDYLAHQTRLESEFNAISAKKKYGVDAYIVCNYPEEHKLHIRTKSDLIYWRNLFGKTKVNKRRKQQFQKGFIQLNF